MSKQINGTLNLKKIAFFAGLLQGGAEKQVVETLRLLADQGHSVSLYNYNLRKAFYTVDPRVRVFDLQSPARFLPEFVKKLIVPIRLAQVIRQDKPDVVISYTTMLNTLLGLSRLFLTGNKRPVLIGSDRNSSLRYTNSKIWALICRMIYPLLNGLYANNHSALNSMKSLLHLKSERLKYLPNILDLARFQRICDKQPFCINKDTYQCPLILVPARITAQKNQIILVDLANRLKAVHQPVRFILAGLPDGQYAQNLQEKIKQADLSEYFEFTGSIKAIEYYYQSCDLVFLPSLYEGLSNSLIEAMACEALVLCSDIPSFSELIKDSQNGYLIDTKLPELVFDKLRIILALSEDKKEMIRKNARQTVLQFGPETYYLNLMEIIEALS